MQALAEGSHGKAVVWPHHVPKGKPFVIWGHRWNAVREVRSARLHGADWWLIDNGFSMPARGSVNGYYTITRRGVAPTYFPDADLKRLPTRFSAWRPNPDGHILLTMSGLHFGTMLNFRRERWLAETLVKLSKLTRRKVVVRNKETEVPLQEQLDGAWCLVTHSSKTAIDAIRQGIPAVVHEWNPAAKICSTTLADIEDPRLATASERRQWWASLMAQQFTLREMRQGLPYKEVITW